MCVFEVCGINQGADIVLAVDVHIHVFHMTAEVAVRINKIHDIIQMYQALYGIDS